MSVLIRQSLAALVSGFVFAIGLALSGLANPDKVLQFLTLNSRWSPALLFTMAAGIVVTYVGFRFVLRRGALFSDTLHLPTRTDLDARLLGGAAIFGIGWGLAGFCPGPALTTLTSGHPEPLVFVVAMIAGSLLQTRTVQPA
ncbi:MAG: DUF6691 family protein [Woeseiaceae bacterium]|nr:DUF6691 family protein [Woeseiaceae bacterium]